MGSEQWVLESFKRTMHLPRDFTIICHTRISDKCIFTGRKSLSLKDFREWDKHISSETLHIFNLSDEYPFNFTQGYKLNNKYYLIPELSDEYPQLRYFSAHHMNLNGNLLLANDVIHILKNHFKEFNNGS